MNMSNIQSAQRMLFLTIVVLLCAGIWLTGVETVHWLLYVPVVILSLAAITGFCPGMALFKQLGLK